MDMAAQLMQHPSCCLNICLHLVKPLLQFVVLILSDTAAGAFRGCRGARRLDLLLHGQSGGDSRMGSDK